MSSAVVFGFARRSGWVFLSDAKFLALVGGEVWVGGDDAVNVVFRAVGDAGGVAFFCVLFLKYFLRIGTGVSRCLWWGTDEVVFVGCEDGDEVGGEVFPCGECSTDSWGGSSARMRRTVSGVWLSVGEVCFASAPKWFKKKKILRTFGRFSV